MIPFWLKKLKILFVIFNVPLISCVDYAVSSILMFNKKTALENSFKMF